MFPIHDQYLINLFMKGVFVFFYIFLAAIEIGFFIKRKQNHENRYLNGKFLSKEKRSEKSKLTFCYVRRREESDKKILVYL